MAVLEVDVAIVGGGPAGLFAAERLARPGRRVVVFERMPSVARKFLMAGRGGLNLTHSEPLPLFLNRYGDRRTELAGPVEAFGPEAMRQWAEGLGQETFVGSSGRVFPKAMKTSPLLRAWLRRLEEAGVEIRTRHCWQGFDPERRLAFDTPDGPLAVAGSATLLALGGASWPRLGSDGSWAPILTEAGIGVAPLKPANSGVLVRWSRYVIERVTGAPLKRTVISLAGRSAQGECVVTETGLEGGVIYALSDVLRGEIERNGRAELTIDLRPDRNLEGLAHDLSRVPAHQSASNRLRKGAKLDPAAIAILNEAARPLPRDAMALASAIKSVKLTVEGVQSLERAISTAGGVRFGELMEDQMLSAHPGVFVAGEMLDWEAPTGGYLLQGVFATAARAAEGIEAWLSRAS